MMPGIRLGHFQSHTDIGGGGDRVGVEVIKYLLSRGFHTEIITGFVDINKYIFAYIVFSTG